MAKKYINLIFILIILISVLITLYGGYSIYRSSNIQNENIENYTIVEKEENDNISSGINNMEMKNESENNLNSQSINEFIGTIIFENGRTVKIYDIPTEYHMKIGSGKLNNNSKLNERGNNILLSHNPGNFSELNYLEIGDIIKIDNGKNLVEYKVVEVNITSEDDPTPYKSTDELTLTLITCYQANNTKRIIVIAKEV